tara:strand:+ start:1073 stop:1321 length:249 start_codon:yes stop_codon:yes gene_type:complete
MATATNTPTKRSDVHAGSDMKAMGEKIKKTMKCNTSQTPPPAPQIAQKVPLPSVLATGAVGVSTIRPPILALKQKTHKQSKI